jgi:DNA helicase HerA-like ATPase
LDNVNVTIGPTDRVLIVGRTGSGKSTLARVLSNGYRNLVVIDPKHEEELPRSITVFSAREFVQVYPQRSTRVLVRPDPADPDELVATATGRVLAYRRARLLFHEVVDYASSTRILPELRRAEKIGRSLEVGVTVCSQRPMGLHNDVIAESEHIFIFDLAMAGDRDKLAGIAGDGARERIAEEFGFLYAGPGTRGDVVRCPPLRL